MTPVNLLEAQVWTFAKTMPKNPHYWSVKEDWPSLEEFFEAVVYIREHGTTKTFFGTVYIVFYHNGWRYWTMGAPLHKTRLINRAKIDESDPAWAREGLASAPD